MSTNSDNNLIIQRRNAECKKFGIILMLLIIYGIYCCISTLRIPCVFHLITGLDCPGCGMTRAAVALMHFDIKGAWNNNVLSLTVVPVLLIILLVQEIRYIKSGKKEIKLYETILFAILLVIAIGYGVIRNI